LTHFSILAKLILAPKKFFITCSKARSLHRIFNLTHFSKLAKLHKIFCDTRAKALILHHFFDHFLFFLFWIFGIRDPVLGFSPARSAAKGANLWQPSKPQLRPLPNLRQRATLATRLKA
jgi:hypothetical protein